MPVVPQLVVTAANRPGTLARVCETLAAGRVNITGLDCSGPQRQIRLLVNNTGRAERLLCKAGVRARVEEVLAVTLPDRPGSLGRVARKLARAGININYGYATVPRGSRRATIVLGVGSPRRAARRAR